MATEKDSPQQHRARLVGRWRYAIIAALSLAAGAVAGLLLATGERQGGAPSPLTGGTAERAGMGLDRLIRHSAPKAVPDVAFVDGDGNARHLSEWRGKVVLLNLWATWCAPCKTEMPSLDRLQAKLGGSNFTVLALSTDRTGPTAPSAFFAKEGIRHLALFNDDTAEANIQLKAEGLPLTILLDTDGREIARLLGPAEWDSQKAADTIESLIARGGG
jgi:thiol-disulfide isomerase/thioredoxin